MLHSAHKPFLSFSLIQFNFLSRQNAVLQGSIRSSTKTAHLFSPHHLLPLYLNYMQYFTFFTNIINRLSYKSATLPFPCGTAWCSNCSRDDSLCTGPPEQSRGVRLCVYSICECMCTRDGAAQPTVAGLIVKLCINELRLR